MTVKCPICGREFRFINNMHLKSHNLTTVEFKEKFPDCETVSSEYHEVRSNVNKQQMYNIHHNSSEEYLSNRYKNISKSKAEFWQNASDEFRQKHRERTTIQFHEMNKNEDIKRKRYDASSISMKKYWENISDEEYQKRCQASRDFWENLSEDERLLQIEKCCMHNIGKTEYTINGKKFYFRSKFEYVVANYLSEKQIDFKYEPFIIPLLNTKYHRYHIIDFYIPKYNLIIECHAHSTQNESDEEVLEDISIKKESAVKLGYNYECLWYMRHEKYLIELQKILDKFNKI